MYKKTKKILIMLAFILSITGCNRYTSNEIENYGNFFNADFMMISDLEIFPKKISEDALVNEYLFDYSDAIIDSVVMIFLDITYSEEDYAIELNRIKNIESSLYAVNGSFESKEHIIYDDQNFQVPAYVTNYESDSVYEYAIPLEEEKRIIYVYLEYYPLTDISFDTMYLPKLYSSEM